MTEQVDVLVVGGGQAGLAASYRLVETGVSHLVVDASTRVGDSWRHRYHSLALFTPRRLSSLPGVPLDGDPEGYAGGLEFADYLERYCATNGLPVMSGTRVVRLRVGDADGFVAVLDGSAVVRSRAVLVCTGGFQQAIVPVVASRFGPEVVQLTMSTYRSPLSVGRGTVLVVGDGASGRDIAVELATTNEVLLATGKPRRLFPQRVFGISTWTLMDRVGLLSVSSRSPIGRMMQAADPLPRAKLGDAAWPRRGHPRSPCGRVRSYCHLRGRQPCRRRIGYRGGRLSERRQLDRSARGHSGTALSWSPMAAESGIGSDPGRRQGFAGRCEGYA